MASLETNTRWLFLTAAGLLAVFATNTAMGTFAGTSYPAIQNFVGPGGFVVGTLGLIGLYPTLAREVPTLARVARAVAVLPALGWTLIVLGGIGETAGVVGGISGPLVVVPIGTIVVTTLTYTLYGITMLRAGGRHRIIGGFVLLPAVMFVLLITRLTTPFVIDAGHFLGHAGVAVVLWTAPGVAETSGSAADPVS